MCMCYVYVCIYTHNTYIYIHKRTIQTAKGADPVVFEALEELDNVRVVLRAGTYNII